MQCNPQQSWMKSFLWVWLSALWMCSIILSSRCIYYIWWIMWSRLWHVFKQNKWQRVLFSLNVTKTIMLFCDAVLSRNSSGGQTEEEEQHMKWLAPVFPHPSAATSAKGGQTLHYTSALNISDKPLLLSIRCCLAFIYPEKVPCQHCWRDVFNQTEFLQLVRQ